MRGLLICFSFPFSSLFVGTAARYRRPLFGIWFGCRAVFIGESASRPLAGEPLPPPVAPHPRVDVPSGSLDQKATGQCRLSPFSTYPPILFSWSSLQPWSENIKFLLTVPIRSSQAPLVHLFPLLDRVECWAHDLSSFPIFNIITRAERTLDK